MSVYLRRRCRFIHGRDEGYPVASFIQHEHMQGKFICIAQFIHSYNLKCFTWGEHLNALKHLQPFVNLELQPQKGSFQTTLQYAIKNNKIKNLVNVRA